MALRRYWQELGSSYYAPVTAAWKRGGLPAVAAYWRAFFDAEPGAEVRVEATPDRVSLDVRVCPAIKHLRAHARAIVPCFCQHCYYVSEAAAPPRRASPSGSRAAMAPAAKHFCRAIPRCRRRTWPKSRRPYDRCLRLLRALRLDL